MFTPTRSRPLLLTSGLLFLTTVLVGESVALSPSGNFAAIQDHWGDVWLLTSGTSDKKLLLHAKDASVALQWPANDHLLLVTGQGRVSGYEIPSGRRRWMQTGSLPHSFPQVAPNGRYLAAIRNHDLWLTDFDSKFMRPITKGDSPNILSGEPDPVFAHEFHTGTHYWWASDSTSIAFIETEFSTNSHYPKPGTILPTFRLKLAQIPAGSIRTIAESSEEWPYILRVAFHPDSRRLFFYRLNRLQTKAELCVWENGTIRIVVTENDDYWFNAPDAPLFAPDGNQFVITSERSGHRHAYLYSLDGALIRDLTPRSLEVTHLLPTPEAKEAIYLIGSTGNQQEQHLFTVNTKTSGVTQLTTEHGWHDIAISSSGNSCLDTYSSSLKPPSVTWRTSQKPARIVLEQSSAETPVANDYLAIKTHDNVPLPARLFKPDDFDPQKKYPVILYTFSGPADRVVADAWDGWQMAWNRSMVRKGYLVLAVDVRGSGGYTHLFEEYIHYRFGAQETVDLREVVSYLHTQTYVDPQRIGIWGCDYGAHIVIHAMFEFPHGFKAGFADSPITDWHVYNAYFTERYLGLPGQRVSEYDDSSALENAKRLTGALLVAGRPDNPIILAEHVTALRKALEEAQHGLLTNQFYFVNYDSHQPAPLLKEMTAFFDKNL